VREKFLTPGDTWYDDRRSPYPASVLTGQQAQKEKAGNDLVASGLF